MKVKAKEQRAGNDGLMAEGTGMETARRQG
jgi:hypothetical protein